MANLKYYNPSTSQWETIIAGQKGETGIVTQEEAPTDTSVLWLDTTDEGVGIPLGGSTGQALVKVDGSDFNTNWVSIPQLIGGNTFTGTQASSGSFSSTSTSSDARFTATNTSNASTDYLYLLSGANDTGTKATHFVNSSTRATDGGANSYTIRNDGGSLVLGVSSFATVINGVTRIPNQPAFSAMRRAGTLGNVSSPTAIIYDSTHLNNGSYYNTSNGRFTAPVNGMYRFECKFQKRFGGNFSGYIYKNGVNFDRFIYSDLGGDSPGPGNSIIMYLNASDYVNIFYVHTGGGDVYAASEYFTSFSGHLIG